MTTFLNIPQFFGISIEVYLITALFGLITYFILRRLLRNKIADKKQRNVVVIIGTLLIAPTLYIIAAFIFITIVLFPPEFQKDFDQKTWDDLKELRFEMRDDLVDSRLLEDKKKSEVKKLLGEPDRGDSTDIWTYDLGVSGAGFGWQFNDLKVHFVNDKVNKTELIEIID